MIVRGPNGLFATPERESAGHRLEPVVGNQLRVGADDFSTPKQVDVRPLHAKCSGTEGLHSGLVSWDSAFVCFREDIVDASQDIGSVE